jgi:uncharacterized membrane protein
MEEIKAMKFSTVIGAIGLLISIILIIKNKKRKDKSKISIKITIPILIVFFALFIIGVSNLPAVLESMQNSKQAAEDYHDLEQLVSDAFQNGQISTSGDVLTITYTEDSLGEGLSVISVYLNVKDGLQKIYKNYEFKKYNTIIIKAMTKLPDKNINSNREVGISLTFDQSELQKITNFNDIYNDQLIIIQGKHKTYVHPDILKKIDENDIKQLFPND